MATKLLFYDNDNNEMECYLNDKGKLFLRVGQIGREDDVYYSGFITLDRDDVSQFINVLTELEQEMEE